MMVNNLQMETMWNIPATDYTRDARGAPGDLHGDLQHGVLSPAGVIDCIRVRHVGLKQVIGLKLYLLTGNL